ncbi:MAG: hypothetical protein RIB60_07590 [Phycisphaerales bacterium]
MNEQRRQLEEHVGAIHKAQEQGQILMFEIGRRLEEINTLDLHKLDDPARTFVDFVHDEFGFTRQRAHQLMDGYAIRAQLEGRAQVLPSTERQTRALSRVAPEKREDAWTRALEVSGGKPPSSDLIEQAAKSLEPIPDDEHAVSPEQTSTSVDATPAAQRDATDARIETGQAAFDELMAMVSVVSKKCSSVYEEFGAFIARESALTAPLQRTREALKSARPESRCLECAGDPDGCEACRGTGWIPKYVYESSPDELKGGA